MYLFRCFFLSWLTYVSIKMIRYQICKSSHGHIRSTHRTSRTTMLLLKFLNQFYTQQHIPLSTLFLNGGNTLLIQRFLEYLAFPFTHQNSNNIPTVIVQPFFVTNYIFSDLLPRSCFFVFLH